MRIGKRTTRKEKSPSQEISLNDYFEECAAIFRQAQQSQESISFDFTLAGRAIRLSFAGAALLSPLTNAFKHLPAKKHTQPELTINIWEGATTGATPPQPFPDEHTVSTQQVERTVNLENPTIFTQGGGYFLACQPAKQHISLLDTESNQAFFWLPNTASAVPLESHPLRTILQWYLRQHNKQIIHAGAVGLEDGGVILTGKSGSGKSTAALACLLSDLLFAGDENVILETGKRQHVHSVYSSANLDDHALNLLPFVQPALAARQNPAEEKHTLFLHETFPQKLAAGFPLKGIVIPAVTAKGRNSSRVQPASPVAALTALAPTSLFQLPGDAREAFKAMTETVRAVPSFILELGEELESIPGSILELLETL